MLEINPDSVPSIFDIVRESFPPGTELVEVVTPDGRSYSGDELKAIEWQERKMQGQEINAPISEGIRKILSDMHQGVPAVMPIKIKKVRKLKQLFKYENQILMLCDDDTLWAREGASWRAIGSEALPPIPQEA